MPQSGWQWIGTDDLGDITGNCEQCGKDIRYVYAIVHPNWSAMAVGTDCCDRLTGTTEAAEYHHRYLKAVDARKRFVGSKRWKEGSDGSLQIRQKRIDVAIRALGAKYLVFLNELRGRTEYDSIIDAKIRIFDLIESGEADAFLARRRKREIDRLRRQMNSSFGVRRITKFRTSRAWGNFHRLNYEDGSN